MLLRNSCNRDAKQRTCTDIEHATIAAGLHISLLTTQTEQVKLATESLLASTFRSWLEIT
jgi:hypothetical protein